MALSAALRPSVRPGSNGNGGESAIRLAYTRALTEIAKSDPRILLMTADLGFMVLEEFVDAHPTRFFNVGVAEANMVGLATGLAASGYVPFVYSIETFASMRGYEQIRNGPLLVPT